MEKNDRIFVDSNYFVALFNPADTLYQKAQAIGRVLDEESSHLTISNFIFLETVTVLSQKRGKAVALQVGEYLRISPLLEIIHVDEALNEDSWRIFQSVKDKNISFVDCSTIAAMKAEHILHLLTFDITDFQKLKPEYRFTFFTGGQT